MVIDAQARRKAMKHGCDAGKKVKGRKQHRVVDPLGLLRAVSVTAANVQNREVRILWSRPRWRNTCASKRSSPTRVMPGNVRKRSFSAMTLRFKSCAIPRTRTSVVGYIRNSTTCSR